ncbi:hypothetical protein PT2222_110154 [Paraburkholderia tropica]
MRPVNHRVARERCHVTRHSCIAHSIFALRRHDLHDDGPVVPEDVVNARLKLAQGFGAEFVESQDHGGTLSGAGHALDLVERRTAVSAEKRVDLVRRNVRVDISNP